MAMTATATIVTRKNIAGTAGIGTIIGTITIEIMIGIDAARCLKFSDVRSPSEPKTGLQNGCESCCK
jgi:hypothetical protein